MTAPFTVLKVQSSVRRESSATRPLVDRLAADFAGNGARVATRDLADGVALIDDAWVGANFTDPQARTAEQARALAFSDTLIEELEAADVIVIGVPMYNFTIPAALKAWIDLVARARRTFQYTEKGPEGLLKGKRAVLVVASGGAPVGSPVDFATGYLKHVLAFIGIEDVTVIDAAGQALDAEGANARAARQLTAAAAAIAEDLSQAA